MSRGNWKTKWMSCMDLIPTNKPFVLMAGMVLERILQYLWKLRLEGCVIPASENSQSSASENSHLSTPQEARTTRADFFLCSFPDHTSFSLSPASPNFHLCKKTGESEKVSNSLCCRFCWIASTWRKDFRMRLVASCSCERVAEGPTFYWRCLRFPPCTASLCFFVSLFLSSIKYKTPFKKDCGEPDLRARKKKILVVQELQSYWDTISTDI